MKHFLKPALITTIWLLIHPDLLYAQCNPTPCTNPAPHADPTMSCAVPEPNELTCYNGATSSDPAVVFPSWCGNNINTQWFAFTAIAPTTSFVIANYSCSQGNVLQSAAFSTSDCVNFSIISDWINIPAGQSGGVNAVGMVPGQVYYLCIGGSNGAICNFQINPPGWGGFAVNCVLEDLGLPYFTYATDAIWSVQPSTAATFDPPTGPLTDITWLEPGVINLCVNSSNCPEYCQTVEVAGGVFEEYINLCQGSSVQCGGHTYSAPGIYTIVEPDGPWCEKTTHCNVHLVPTTFTTETVYMCLNSAATCAGEEFYAPGTFPVTLTGFLGCDSIVSCKIIAYPATPVTNLTINLCGPAEYQVCEDVFTISGSYSTTCKGWLGCDSIVNLNLAILDPQAIIDPPEELSCQQDTIILNGNNSPANTASGGTTTYKWSGPGIIGNTNLPTAAVNQPGTYCLVVRHARGNLACSDTTCVQVTVSAASPLPPLLTGNSAPCLDSTTIYTVTPNGLPVPAFYNWTLPANLPYTTLSPNSIQVTWDTLLSGTICAAAGNACGVSPDTCLPVSVLAPVQQPVITGPAVVCAGGGNYWFTLDTLPANVNYTWTIPPGAVITGTGDSVQINFLNAASGQVCVTPENSCGTGLQVCSNVQVNPIPTASISRDTNICAGISTGLQFMFTGNGPFDVSWSVNNQIFTLQDITSVHTEIVNPAQTTVYTITQISDNAACSAVVSDSVTVTVWQAAQTTISTAICTGESLLAGGSIQTTSGVYTDTLQTVHGCDSVILTVLTVQAIDTTVLQTSTCDPALAGSTTAIFNQVNGCDSLVITVAALHPSDTTLLFDSSCNPGNTGVFIQHLNNRYGCDSLVVNTVVFALSDTSWVNNTTCDPAAAGVFNQQLLTGDGCDSLVITTVTLLPVSTTHLSGATCDPALAGVFTEVLTNQSGCDSTVITTVTLLPNSTTTLSATSCNPAHVGVFTQVLTNYLGCDSTVTTTVSLAPLPQTFLTAATCDPAAAGVFSNTWTTTGGCDSTVTTTVTLLPTSTTTLSATSCNPAHVGVFTQVLTNYLGCDSTVTTTVSLDPLPQIFLTATTCDPAAAGVFSNTWTTAGGCDSTVTTTVTLLPTSTTTLSATSCNPAHVGVFTQVLTNYLGCDSTVTTTVSLDPLPQTFLTATTCDPAAAGVFSNTWITPGGCDSTVTTTVSLLPTSTTTLSATSCNPADVGISTTVLTNYLGCDSMVITETTLLPANSCSVAVNLTGSNIPCDALTGTLTLLPTVGTAPFLYTVLQGSTVVATGTIPGLAIPQVVGGLPAGNYTIQTSSANGFQTTAQAAVIQLTPPQATSQVTSGYNGFDISCPGAADGAALVTATGGMTPYTFSWSNGANSAAISQLAAGTYTVTVIDTNGCTSISTVAIAAPPPLDIHFIVNDPDCFNQQDGAIQAVVSGGAAPYRYTLNNGPVQPGNTFTNLDQGVYSLTVSDANDCTQTEIIVVNGVTQLDVTLGDDIYIGLGDSATLQAIVNVPPDSILSVVWSPPLADSLECTTCLTQTVTPFVSTVYTIQVQALNGCTDQDQVQVIVDRRRHIYVPNIFTPDTDGGNQLFTIYAKPGSVSKILSLQVFDRWGEALFAQENFQPNNPEAGWDGNWKGKPMNPGVFVWIAEMEFIDGQKEIFKGDVTIVR